MKSLKSGSIVSNVVANYVGQGLTAVMAIAFLPIYIRFLGLEAYGLIGFFAVLQSILALFDFGITATVTREAARYNNGVLSIDGLRGLVRSFETIGGISNTILALAIWGLAIQFANDWVNASTLTPESIVISVSLMGLVIATRLQEGIYRGLLLGLDRQVKFNVANTLIATARYVGAIVVLRYGSVSVEAFFAWQVFISLVSLIAFGATAYLQIPKGEQRAHFTIRSLRPVWRFSAGMTVVSGLSILLANLDKLILSKMLPLEEFGRYTLAAVAASVLYMFAVPITQSVYPRMIGTFSNGDKAGLARLHHATSQLIVVLAGSAAVVLALFPMQVVYVWSGDFTLTTSTASLLAILSVAAFLNCLGYIGHNLLMACAYPGRLAKIIFSTVLITVLTLPWTVKYFGLDAVAYLLLGIAVLQALAVLLVAHHSCVVGEGRRWLVQDITPPLTGAVFAACFAFLWRPGLEEGRGILAAFLICVSCLTLAVSALLASEVRSRLLCLIIQRPI